MICELEAIESVLFQNRCILGPMLDCKYKCIIFVRCFEFFAESFRLIKSVQ